MSALMSHTAKRCPSCKEMTVEERLHPGRVLIGLVVTIVCGFLAVPTLGVSLIFMMWAIMYMIKRPTCTACGWKKGQDRVERVARR